MHLAGETEIAATRLRVWETISNPNRAAESNSAGQAQIEKSVARLLAKGRDTPG